MSNIFFSADSHYGHKNLVRGTTSWNNPGEECRDFETLEEHNAAIVDGLNKYVREQDTLYHVGDWAFGGLENVFKFRDRVNCGRIHLVLGNHDIHIANNKRWYDQWTRSLFNTVALRIDKKICGVDFTLHHYSMRTWNKGHYGAIHLYGHSHDGLPEYEGGGTLFKCMDVGVDTAKRMFGEYRPFHIEEIFKIMSDRAPLEHHRKKEGRWQQR